MEAQLRNEVGSLSFKPRQGGRRPGGSVGSQWPAAPWWSVPEGQWPQLRVTLDASSF